MIRVYLPPDANTLLSVARPLPAQPPLRQRHRRRQAAVAQLAVDGRGDPPLHPRDRDLGLGEQRPGRRARRRHRPAPGDIPTLETLAAADLLRQHLPDAQGPVRQRRRPDAAPGPRRSTRTGCPTTSSTRCSRTDRPIVFAYHGYPWLIHRLTYRRTNHANLHVRGYKEEGTTTTPFDMVMLNDLDRFHLVIDVIDRVPGLAARAGHVRQQMVDKRIEARAYTRLEGEDAPEIARLDLAGADDSGPDPRRQRGIEQPQAPGPRPVGRASSASADLPPPAGADDAASRGARRSRRLGAVDAVGHRVVHGGTRFTAPVRRSTPDVARRARGADRRSPRSTSRGRSRGSRRSRRRCPASRRSPASTPRSTPRSRPPRRPTRCPREWRERWASAGSGSTGCRTPTPRGGSRSCWAGPATRRCGSSRATSARARRWRPCSAGGPSTRRWGSRRSRAS